MSTQKFATNALHAGHDVSLIQEPEPFLFINQQATFLTVQSMQQICLIYQKLDLFILE